MNRARYFNYLLEKVDAIRNAKRSRYKKLLWLLFSEEFRWDYAIYSDSCRAGDALSLRSLYLESERAVGDTDDDEPCNVLEVLVALSIRIELDLVGEPGNEHPEKWFWEMIDNLGLSGMTDDKFDEMTVINVIGEWMGRGFKKNGDGGLFPLKKPSRDQRKTPIWDQMAEYLNERY